MKKTTFKQCAAGDVFEHQGQALIKTTKPNTAVNLNSGAFAHFHDGSLVDRSDLVLIHQADLPSEMPDSLKEFKKLVIYADQPFNWKSKKKWASKSTKTCSHT